jgi:hypothetical protein
MPHPILGRLELFRGRSEGVCRKRLNGIVRGLGTVSSGELLGKGQDAAMIKAQLTSSARLAIDKMAFS